MTGTYQIFTITESRGVDHGWGIFAVIGVGLALLVRVIFSLRGNKRWESEVSADFDAALMRMHIHSYKFLVDRTVAPGYETSEAVYRILIDQDGRYFLYMLVEGTTGLTTPISKERALLAAKTNGYKSES